MQTCRQLAKAREEQSSAQRQIECLSWKVRELHVACRARTRTLVSVNLDLENRLMWEHQRLLQTVPAERYFMLLDRYMTLVHDKHTSRVLPNSVRLPLKAKLQDPSLSSASTGAQKSQAVRCNNLLQLDHKDSGEPKLPCTDGNVAAEAQAGIGNEEAEHGRELSCPRTLIDELQTQLASEAQSMFLV